jgi:hypothetical protein
MTKSAEKRGTCIDPHGFDAGKLIKGNKRHVFVDRLGLLLNALVTPADVQDRDGGLMVLSTLFGQFPFLKKLFADTAYPGPVFPDGLALAMPGLISFIGKTRCWFSGDGHFLHCANERDRRGEGAASAVSRPG